MELKAIKLAAITFYAGWIVAIIAAWVRYDFFSAMFMFCVACIATFLVMLYMFENDLFNYLDVLIQKEGKADE